MNPSDPAYGEGEDYILSSMPLNANDSAGGGFGSFGQISELFGLQEGELPQSQGSSFSVGSLFSQGTLDTLLTGADGNMNNYPVTTMAMASEMGHFPPTVIGDDEFLVGEMGMVSAAPRSIIGNKNNGKKLMHGLDSGRVNTDGFGYNINQEDVSSSQSSDISQEAKIPSLDQYPGKYNFVVKLGQNTNKKTAVYSSDLNLLYCNNDTKILFSLKLDCNEKAMKDLKVKSEVVFSENNHIMEPVQRCITCLNKEAKAGGMEFTSIPEDSVMHHVIRDHYEAAEYHRHDTQKRYYTLAALERPQLGCDSIPRNYEFKCLNTCFVKEKKRLSVIFTLMENNKPVGRSVMALKICSCPTRDYKNDKIKLDEKNTKKDQKIVKAKDGTRKRRANEQVAEAEKLDLADVIQKQRCVSPPPMSTLNIKSEPGTGTGALGEARAIDRRGRGLFSQSNSEPDDSEVDLSQSQAGSQESFCSRTLSKIAPDIKMAYELKKTGDEKDKVFADTLFGMLKTFHRTSEKYKTMVSSPRNGAAAAPQEQEPTGHGSPDSGVNAKTP